jgi:membrane-bound ClpP family serine protease
MSIAAIVLIITLGFILFLLEFLIIPGITVAGVAAFLLVAGGIFCGYYFHGHSVGNLIFLITGVSMIVLFVIMLKSKTWRRLGLNSTIDGKVGVIDEGEIKVGDQGITVSKLSPIGKGLFNGKLFEIRSDGSYLEANVAITITHIEGNKIYIETKK